MKFFNIFGQLIFQCEWNCTQHFLAIAGWQLDVVQMDVRAVDQDQNLVLF